MCTRNHYLSNFNVNYASTAGYSNAASAKWISAALAGSTSSSDAVSARIMNNGGTGDSDVAALGFLAQNNYGIHLHLRADGYFGLGGYSRGAWSWYSDPNGNMVAAGNVTAYSDPKLKENIEPITSAVNIIQQLNGVYFTWKEGIKHTEVKSGKKDLGILADEVEAVLPEIVHQSISIEGESYKTVSYEKLVPVLIQAIKELKSEIDDLKGKIK